MIIPTIYKSTDHVFRMQKLTVVVFAAVISICSAYGGQNFFFPPAPLICYVQNRLFGLPGQDPSKVEDVPVIPFQPALPGEVYLPLNSRYIVGLSPACTCHLVPTRGTAPNALVYNSLRIVYILHCVYTSCYVTVNHFISEPNLHMLVK